MQRIKIFEKTLHKQIYSKIEDICSYINADLLAEFKTEKQSKHCCYPPETISIGQTPTLNTGLIIYFMSFLFNLFLVFEDVNFATP